MSEQSTFSHKPADSERLQRIAAILCKIILLGEAGEALRSPVEETTLEPTEEVAVLATCEHPDDQRILRYLDLVRKASPAEIRGTLGLSRSSAWRALQRLARARRIRGNGQTRQLIYQLNAGEPTAERIGLN